MELEDVKNQFLRLLKKLDENDWASYEVVLEFPPFINKGYNALPMFKNVNGEVIDLSMKRDMEFTNTVLSFIATENQHRNFNQIQFSVKKQDLEQCEISVGYNPAIEENFQNNLPKSKKGKTHPWWKNPEETSGLI